MAKAQQTQEEVVNQTPAEVAAEKDSNQVRLEEIQKRAEELQKKYNEQHQFLLETDETIKDLEDRIKKQKEARNIFRSAKSQIEQEYDGLVKEANRLEALLKNN